MLICEHLCLVHIQFIPTWYIKCVSNVYVQCVYSAYVFAESVYVYIKHVSLYIYIYTNMCIYVLIDMYRVQTRLPCHTSVCCMFICVHTLRTYVYGYM